MNGLYKSNKSIIVSQWTLFARNEKAIEEFKEYIKTEL